ncbi:unnamed protein product, partial [marine sediment metagenome]
AALRYEPDVSEIKNALEQVGSNEKVPVDLGLSPDTENALSEFAEEEEVSVEGDEIIVAGAEVEESVEAEAEEDTESAVEIETDEEQAVEEAEIEELIEDTTEETTEEAIVEEISDEGVTDLAELIGSDETLEETSEETAPEEPVQPLEQEEETAGAVQAEEETAETEEAEEEKAEAEEIGEEVSAEEELPVTADSLEESIAAEEEEAEDISFLTEEEEVTSEEGAETVGLTEEENLEVEEETADENFSDLTGLIGVEETAEKSSEEDLSHLVGQVDEDMTAEDVEETWKSAGEKPPEYSEMAEEKESAEPESSEQEVTEAGVLEIDDTGDYDISKLADDITSGEGDEPVLSEEERAELLSLEETPPEKEIELKFDENEVVQAEETEDSAETSIEDIYGNLSKDEIDVLSVADTEPDHEENNLKAETKEGIDYSDILQAQEDTIESENIVEEIHGKSGEQEGEFDILSDFDAASYPAAEAEKAEDASIEAEALTAEEPEEP